MTPILPPSLAFRFEHAATRQPCLYLGDVLRTHRVTLANVGTEAVALAPHDGAHLALYFRPGEVDATGVTVRGPDGWTATAQKVGAAQGPASTGDGDQLSGEETEGTVRIGLVHNAAGGSLVLEPGEVIALVLHGIRAETGLGVRTTEVQLRVAERPPATDGEAEYVSTPQVHTFSEVVTVRHATLDLTLDELDALRARARRIGASHPTKGGHLQAADLAPALADLVADLAGVVAQIDVRGARAFEIDLIGSRQVIGVGDAGTTSTLQVALKNVTGGPLPYFPDASVTVTVEEYQPVVAAKSKGKANGKADPNPVSPTRSWGIAKKDTLKDTHATIEMWISDGTPTGKDVEGTWTARPEDSGTPMDGSRAFPFAPTPKARALPAGAMLVVTLTGIVGANRTGVGHIRVSYEGFGQGDLYGNEELSVDVGKVVENHGDKAKLSMYTRLDSKVVSTSIGVLKIWDQINTEEFVSERLWTSSLHVSKDESGKKGDLTVAGELTVQDAAPGYPVPSGTIVMWHGDDVPAGWVLCDGNNGSPDLRGRFVVCAGAGQGYDVGATGGEERVRLIEDQMPAHTHGYKSSSYENHTHKYKLYVSSDNLKHGDGQDHSAFSKFKSDQTAVPSSPMDSLGLQLEEAGEGMSHENRPPFYALCFIMKT